MRLRWVSVVVCAVVLALSAEEANATGAMFDSYQFEALIDRDSNDATGCDVAAQDDNFSGPIHGIEYKVTAFAQRFPASATIDAVNLEECVSGTTFAPVATIDNVNWNAGLENGTGGADVVEFRVPRDAIGNPDNVTLAFHATRIFFNDVLLTTNGEETGDPIVFELPAVQQVPVLSFRTLGLCALLLAGIAWRANRRRHPATLIVTGLAFLASTVTVVWAATIVLDGNVMDWNGIPPIATDLTNDSSADDPGEDIAAAFVTADAQYIYFRMDQVNLAPAACGNGSIEAGEECENSADCSSMEHCEACDCEED